MRYLLIFHSEDTGQWRCLDSASFDPALALGLDGLPNALNSVPEITVPWVLGRRSFALADQVEPGGQTGEGIRVYALDPDRAVISQGVEYHGAWLEMFMEQNRPLGGMVVHRPSPAPEITIDALKARADDPLRARAEACQQTMDHLRAQQDVRSSQPHEPVAGMRNARERV